MWPIMPVLPVTEEAIAAAAQALVRGETVAFPTETVYGLGANACDPAAVARIFTIKDRPRFNPLIVHVSDRAAAERLAEFGEPARVLGSAFWPGPLTLVLPKRPRSGIADLATAGLDTIALRVPGNEVAQALLTEAKVPIAAPSANRSGRISPTMAAHVVTELGDSRTMILDGGQCDLGIESTVISLVAGEPMLLRLGAVPRGEIEAALGRAVVVVRADTPITSPGQLASHYAPDTPLRLNADAARTGEVLLAFGPAVPPCAGKTVNLSATGDLVEAAANLFASLRALDATGASGIAVMPIPDIGLGEAINDRLRRAAQAR